MRKYIVTANMLVAAMAAGFEAGRLLEVGDDMPIVTIKALGPMVNGAQALVEIDMQVGSIEVEIAMDGADVQIDASDDEDGVDAGQFANGIKLFMIEAPIKSA